MMQFKTKAAAYLGGAFLTLLIAACSNAPAGIDSLVITKDAERKTPSATFGQKDTIYAKAVIKSGPGKVKLTWQVFAEKAEGISDNFHISPADVTQEFPNDGSSDYKVSAPPEAGWPIGTYRIEATLVNESGKQEAQKKATFTVAGG